MKPHFHAVEQIWRVQELPECVGGEVYLAGAGDAIAMTLGWGRLLWLAASCGTDRLFRSRGVRFTVLIFCIFVVCDAFVEVWPT